MPDSDRDWLREETRLRTSFLALAGRDVKLTRAGREHVGLCPFHREKSPSFYVNEDKGLAKCYGCGWGGDVFRYVMDRHGCDFPEALTELAVAAGLEADSAGRKPLAPAPIVQRAPPEEITAAAAARIEAAREWWRDAVPGEGSPASVYLTGRGLAMRPDEWPKSLRFHPAVWHPFARARFPAMVAAIQSRDARVRAVHCTFLAPGGGGKAPVGKPKLMFGPAWRGAIRLGPAGPVLHVAEGIETALSVKLATGFNAVWAAGSLGNFAAVELPPVVRELHIWADGDSNPKAMERELNKAAAFHSARSVSVLVHPAPAGQDWNDVLQKGAAA